MMKNLTGKSYLSSSFLWSSSDEPKFFGKVTDHGFDVCLARDVTGNNSSLFSPPMINVVFQGEETVQLQTNIVFTRFQRLFNAVWVGGSLLFVLIWLCAFPIMLIYAGWDNSVSQNEIVTNESASISSWIFFFGVWLLPLVLEGVFFLWLPRRAINRSMKRSKEVIVDLFGGEILDLN